MTGPSEPMQPVAWLDPAYVGGGAAYGKSTSPVTTYAMRGWIPLYAAPSDDARDAARLKQRVSEILADALSGRMERYILKHADPAVQFVRWGRVEDDIHAAIDAAMRDDK